MLNHWKNDTCVGKYLKTMYENRIDRDYKTNKFNGNHRVALRYGGQFLWDAVGVEDRPILMMDGAWGQQVVIDFENNKIITAHSTDRNYDYYALIYLQLTSDTLDNGRPVCRKYKDDGNFVLEPC
jgi:hypothetical protein